MSKERLEELLNDLPHSIRYSGELEPLKQFVREQVERYDECRLDAMELHEENKRYRERVAQLINYIEMTGDEIDRQVHKVHVILDGLLEELE